MRDDLSIKLFDSAAAFDVLREDWQKLFAASDAAPFASFEWTATWFEFFGANRTPFILAAYQNANLIGLLPLYAEQQKVLAWSLKKLSFINSEIGGAAYLDVLALPDLKTAATIAFLEFLNENGGVDVLELEGIAADSVLLAQIRRHHDNRKFNLRVAPLDVCQFAEIAGEGAEFLARIYNDTAKKKLKRLKKLDGFEFRRTTAAADVAAAFERFIKLHDGNWTDKGGSEISGHRRLLDFHRAAAAAGAAAGAIFFDELWIENRAVAALYGFHKGNKYFYYSSGYEPELAKLSPMIILYNLSIEKGLADSVRTFDFLRGNQSYKSHWANNRNDLVTISLSRRTAPAVIYQTVSNATLKIRDFSKSALPSGVVDKLKAARRKWKRNSRLTTAANGKTAGEIL